MSFLANVLLLLKHAWDESYLFKTVSLIFSSIEVNKKAVEDRNFVEAMFVYYYKITNFNVEQTKEIMEKLSEPLQEIAKSTYDRFVQMGLKEGMQKGMQKGMEKGMEKGDRRRSRIGVHNLREKGFPIEEIAEALELPIAEVQKLLSENKYDEE